MKIDETINTDENISQTLLEHYGLKPKKPIKLSELTVKLMHWQCPYCFKVFPFYTSPKYCVFCGKKMGEKETK